MQSQSKEAPPAAMRGARLRAQDSPIDVFEECSPGACEHVVLAAAHRPGALPGRRHNIGPTLVSSAAPAAGHPDPAAPARHAAGAIAYAAVGDQEKLLCPTLPQLVVSRRHAFG